ncbi:MAG: IS110 family transposase [Mycobacterium sp.]|nr:IS110 family transposase [Mycobacterium sp.]
MEIFVGIDWAEQHHDVAVVDGSGEVLARFRIGDDVAGLTRLTEAVAGLCGDPAAVHVALETDRGLLVTALVAGGYRVFAINPKSVDRYRDRYSVSRAKSDPGDALVLAHLLRTDEPRHRPLAGDSHAVAVIATLARAHHDAVRLRTSESNRLRSVLREFFPAAVEAFPALATKTAMTVLNAAPTPTAAAQLTTEQLWELIRSTGRHGVSRQLPHRLHAIFTAEQMRQPPAVEQAMGCAVRAVLASLIACDHAVDQLEAELGRHFDRHPHAEVLRSLPGLGLVLGARVLGEFGDDPTRFTDADSRRRYAGSAPITRTSGKSRVVLMRRARNTRLADACRWWAFNAISRSDGAQAYYRRRRAAGDGHDAALRRVANKLLGQLHHCLQHNEPYREQTAWPVKCTELAS